MEEKHSDKIPQQESENFENKVEIIHDKSAQNEEEESQFLELLSHPWKLIKGGGKLGIKGVKHFLTVFFLFTTVNTILFCYAINRLFVVDFTVNKIPFVLLVLALGLLVIIYAVRQAYQYIIIDTIRVIYENLSSLFHKIAEYIIDTVENLFGVDVDLDEKKLVTALDFGVLIANSYDKIPKFLIKGIVAILDKVPFVGMLLDLQEDLMKGNKFDASKKLYNKMDGFIGETIFEDNNTNWIWCLLPLNILISGLIIHFGIGAIA